MEFNQDLIEHGTFSTWQLQPDYSFTHNGYGLVQLTATYATDYDNATDSSKDFARGTGLPAGVEGGLSSALAKLSWTCVKAEERGREGKMAYVTAYYAAIDKEHGDSTETEATLTSAVVSENIESHFNFSKIQCAQVGDGVTPLGGKWKEGKPPGVPSDDNPFRALWQQTANVQVNAMAYNFVGFAPTDSAKDPNRKAGVKTWMRPSVTMRLTGYTVDAAMAADTVKRVGWAINNQVGMLVIPAAYKSIQEEVLTLNITDVSKIRSTKKNWLITNSNMEVYGGLYKVSVDLLLSGVVGWDPDIYPYYYTPT